MIRGGRWGGGMSGQENVERGEDRKGRWGGREDGEEIISKWGRADGQDGERIIN